MSAFDALLILSSILFVFLALAVYRRVKTPGAGYFSILMLAAAVWAGCYAAELLSSELSWMVFWASCAYFGILVVPIAWLAFTLAYTGLDPPLIRRVLYPFVIVSVVMLGVVWTNPFHGQFYSQVALVDSPLGRVADYTHGPAFWVNAVFTYVLMMAGSFLLIRSLLLNYEPFRGQAFTLLLAILAPWVGNLMYLTGYNPFPLLDLTPLSFVITGLAIAWALFHDRFLDIVPLAKAHLLANFQDGLIVLDKRQRVVEINPAAEAIFSHPASEVIGREAAQVDWRNESLLPFMLSSADETAEVQTGEGESRRIYDLRATPLKDRAGRDNGRLIVLRDITERVRAGETLDRSEAILEAVHFAATRFLGAPSWEEVIYEVLQRLGEAAEVSRAYIFENQHTPDGNLLTSQRFEWVAPGIQAQIDNPELQNLSFADAGLGRWEESLAANQPVFGRISELPASEHSILTAEQIQSIALSGIFVDQTWWGLIGFDECTYARQWSKAEIDALGAAASVLGSSIQRQKSETTVRRRATELSTLYEISLEINAPRDQSELLEAIVERAMVLLGGTGGGLYLCEPEKGELQCVVSLNTERDFCGTRLKYGEGAAGWVAKTGQPLIIDDYRKWDGRALVYEIEQPFRSVVSAPLIWQDKVVGVIDILHDQSTYQFSQDHLTLLTLFANQAAVALHNAQEYTEAQLKARRVKLLNEITQASIRAPDLKTMLQSLVDHLGELFDADDSYITYWDEEHQAVVPAAANSSLGEAFVAMRPISGELDMSSSVLSAGRVLVAEDIFHSLYISPKIAGLFPARSMMGLPLITDGRKLGAALVCFKRPHRFTPDEIALGEEVSSQIALAMTKVRLLELERQRANELETLRKTIGDLASNLDLSSVLHTILERATGLLNATGGDLGLYDETRQEIRIVVSHNMGKDYTGCRMAHGEGAMGQAIQLGQVVLINDYQNWDCRSAQYQDVAYHAVLAVPLIARGRIIGVLGLVDRNPRRIFSPGDQRLLELFAQQAISAIENARLFTEEKRRSEELGILFESSTALVKTLDLDEVYRIATGQLARAANATSARILTCDLQNGLATIVAEYASSEANEKEAIFDEGVTYDLSGYPRTLAALREGRALAQFASSPYLDPGDRLEMRTYGIKSALQLPMIASDDIIGYAEIWESRTERLWSEEEIQLCQTLANQAALVIENARLYSQMQYLAVTDTLSGVLNRRGLFDRGQHEVNRALRFSTPLAAIMLDIDHFKHINDTYSHAVGDEVLRTLARVCQANLRSVDLIGRYGGEEFAILLPDTDADSARQVAERLRQAVADTPVIIPKGQVSFTVSLGVASLVVGTTTLAVLLDQADTAMYFAKRAGRNQVALVDSDVTQSAWLNL